MIAHLKMETRVFYFGGVGIKIKFSYQLDGGVDVFTFLYQWKAFRIKRWPHFIRESVNKNVWYDINQRNGYPYLPHFFWPKTWEMSFWSLEFSFTIYTPSLVETFPFDASYAFLCFFLNIIVILKSELFFFALHRLRRLVAHWQSIGNQIRWRQKTYFYILVSYVGKSSSVSVLQL